MHDEKVMNATELIERIRNEPDELVLDQPIRFRRRTRSNPCSFDDFIRALSDCESITSIECQNQWIRYLTSQQWVQLLSTFASMTNLLCLGFWSEGRIETRHPVRLDVFTRLLLEASDLRDLTVFNWEVICNADGLFGDGLEAFADALARSKLRNFVFTGRLFKDGERCSMNSIVLALAECRFIERVFLDCKQNSVSSEALRMLFQSETLKLVMLDSDRWDDVAVSMEGNTALPCLTLWSGEQIPEEHMCKLATAFEVNSSLKIFGITSSNMFATVEEGIAWANALKINRALKDVSFKEKSTQMSEETLQSTKRACLALSEMLKVNHNVQLSFQFPESVTSSDEYKELQIQMALNRMGRGELLENSTARDEWVNALFRVQYSGQVNPDLVDDCLFSLVRLNPLICLQES